MFKNSLLIGCVGATMFTLTPVFGAEDEQNPGPPSVKSRVVRTREEIRDNGFDTIEECARETLTCAAAVTKTVGSTLVASAAVSIAATSPSVNSGVFAVTATLNALEAAQDCVTETDTCIGGSAGFFAKFQKKIGR